MFEREVFHVERLDTAVWIQASGYGAPDTWVWAI